MWKPAAVALLVTALFVPPAEAQRTLTFAATDDARVEHDWPSTNYAAFNVKASSNGPGCPFIYNNPGCIVSFLRFNVELGANEKVGSATLKVTPPPGFTSEAGFYTQGTSNAWSESTITWANSPPLSQTSGGQSGPTSCSTADCVSANVTNLVPWNGNQASIVLRTNNYFEALSREDGATVAPKLVVVTAPYSDTSLPTTPSPLVQTTATQTSATIGWGASSDNVRVASYRTYLNGVLKGSGLTSRSYTYSGLTCGTSYTATVRAVDPSGNLSAASAPLTIAPNQCGVFLNETFTALPGAPPDQRWVHEDDFWQNTDGQEGATLNPNWFAENGQVLIAGTPDANTARATPLEGKSNFRIWTRKSAQTGEPVFGDVKVTHRLRINKYLPGVASYEGVKLWLRRQLCTPVEPDPRPCHRVFDNANRAGYTVEYALKSGNVYIQKRANSGCTENGDQSDYDIIGTRKTGIFFEGQGWKDNVGGTVKNNSNGSVTIQALINNQVVAEATDTGVACGVGPYTPSGRIGLRSDNTDMSIDDLVVRSLP